MVIKALVPFCTTVHRLDDFLQGILALSHLSAFSFLSGNFFVGCISLMMEFELFWLFWSFDELEFIFLSVTSTRCTITSTRDSLYTQHRTRARSDTICHGSFFFFVSQFWQIFLYVALYFFLFRFLPIVWFLYLLVSDLHPSQKQFWCSFLSGRSCVHLRTTSGNRRKWKKYTSILRQTYAIGPRSPWF